MERLDTLVQRQYESPGLYEEILIRLEEMNIDTATVTRKDIAGVDEFHVRGAEVSRELASQINPDNLKVLDVGCGLGGPSRLLAEEYGCQVSGIDLSHEYVRAATGLSELVGLGEKTNFIQSNALELPFDNNSFDLVWTQHVQMNIRHKLKFYAEIERVLSPQGRFVYYDIFKTEGGQVNYPVPWADQASASFLATYFEMDDILESLCFKKMLSNDETDKGIRFLNELFEKLRLNGPPKLGLNVLMGGTTKEKLNNILKGLDEEQIVLLSGVYVKTGLSE